ncbi:hypothetical protein ACA910_005945 [Epithemia clementina (nom. ined.)]
MLTVVVPSITSAFSTSTNSWSYTLLLPDSERLFSSTTQRFSSPASTASSLVEYDDFLPQPGPHFQALEVVHACMKTLLVNRDAGLEVCFNFASDSCRAALGGSLEEFNHYARNPVFGYLVNCADYEIVSVGPEIQGTPTRGAMQTVLMDAKPAAREDGSASEPRRFLWTMLKERRPPRQGFWTIHEVIYTKNAYQMTM